MKGIVGAKTGTDERAAEAERRLRALLWAKEAVGRGAAAEGGRVTRGDAFILAQKIDAKIGLARACLVEAHYAMQKPAN